MIGYVYILRCAKGAFYVGTTRRPLDRLLSHYRGEGASFTKKRLPVELVYIARVEDGRESELKLRLILKQFGLDLVKKYNPATVNAEELHNKVQSLIKKKVRHLDPLAIIPNLLDYVDKLKIPVI